MDRECFCQTHLFPGTWMGVLGAPYPSALGLGAFPGNPLRMLGNRGWGSLQPENSLKSLSPLFSPALAQE